MRKISSQNRTVPQQLKLFSLTSQAIYLKPLINSFRSNIATRNITSTMSNMEIELNGADQTASAEANAASAAQDYLQAKETYF